LISPPGVGISVLYKKEIFIYVFWFTEFFIVGFLDILCGAYGISSKGMEPRA
jgi:hypothetical protein